MSKNIKSGQNFVKEINSDSKETSNRDIPLEGKVYDSQILRANSKLNMINVKKQLSN